MQGTYETFAEMGRQHFGGDLAGKWILTAGLGGMGGAQPLAAVMAGAHCIAVECQESRIEKRLETRYLDRRATSIDEALEIIRTATEPTSVGLLGNAAEILPEMVARGIRPDAVTDQTSAHDPLNGYLPIGWSVAEWIAKRETDPAAVAAAARASMAKHVEAMLAFQAMGVPTFDYGNNIRQVAKDEGVPTRSTSRASCPPICGRCSAAASGRSAGSRCPAIPRTFTAPTQGEGADPRRSAPPPLARHGARAHRLPGPAGAHLLGRPRPAPPPRPRLQRDGRRGEFGAPIVIGRDHLDSGSVASPNRETEAMKDGSDAVSDWPLLNALLNTASGATWVSFHHGGGVGMGYSQHAGMVIVADGTDDAARRLERVLWNDPATGVMRHADAGYEIAIDCAREQGLDLPMVG